MKRRTIAILKTTTPLRLWNLVLLNVSFKLSTWFNKPIHWGNPVALSIEPTTTCNLKCPQCPSGLRQFSRPTGNLTPELNALILQQVGRQLQFVNFYFQGEPFINPAFIDLVKAARKRNIYVITSTNAHFISAEMADKIVESGLCELIISIDGLSQETYEKYRVNGKLDKVLEGTRNIVEARKKNRGKGPVLVFQFLVTHHNETEIEALQKLATEIGVDEVRLKTVQIYDFEHGNDLIPTNETYSRYKQLDNGRFELKNAFKNSCWRMWSSCVFTWDGVVVPCCFDKDAQHKMGNIKTANFRSIWKSGIYASFRTSVFKDRRAIEICKNCSEGSKIWI